MFSRLWHWVFVIINTIKYADILWTMSIFSHDINFGGGNNLAQKVTSAKIAKIKPQRNQPLLKYLHM